MSYTIEGKRFPVVFICEGDKSLEETLSDLVLSIISSRELLRGCIPVLVHGEDGYKWQRRHQVYHVDHADKKRAQKDSNLSFRIFECEDVLTTRQQPSEQKSNERTRQKPWWETYEQKIFNERKDQQNRTNVTNMTASMQERRTAYWQARTLNEWAQRILASEIALENLVSPMFHEDVESNNIAHQVAAFRLVLYACFLRQDSCVCVSLPKFLYPLAQYIFVFMENQWEQLRSIDLGQGDDGLVAAWNGIFSHLAMPLSVHTDLPPVSLDFRSYGALAADIMHVGTAGQEPMAFDQYFAAVKKAIDKWESDIRQEKVSGEVVNQFQQLISALKTSCRMLVKVPIIVRVLSGVSSGAQDYPAQGVYKSQIHYFFDVLAIYLIHESASYQGYLALIRQIGAFYCRLTGLSVALTALTNPLSVETNRHRLQFIVDMREQLAQAIAEQAFSIRVQSPPRVIFPLSSKSTFTCWRQLAMRNRSSVAWVIMLPVLQLTLLAFYIIYIKYADDALGNSSYADSMDYAFVNNTDTKVMVVEGSLAWLLFSDALHITTYRMKSTHTLRLNNVLAIADLLAVTMLFSLSFYFTKLLPMAWVANCSYLVSILRVSIAIKNSLVPLAEQFMDVTALFIRLLCCCNNTSVDASLSAAFKVFFRIIVPIGLFCFLAPNIAINVLYDSGSLLKLLGFELLGQIIHTIADSISVMIGNVLSSILVMRYLLRKLKHFSVSCKVSAVVGTIDVLNVFCGLVPVGILVKRVMLVFFPDSLGKHAMIPTGLITTHSPPNVTEPPINPQEKLDHLVKIMMWVQWGYAAISALPMIYIVFRALSQTFEQKLTEERREYKWPRLRAPVIEGDAAATASLDGVELTEAQKEEHRSLCCVKWNFERPGNS